MSTDLLIKGLFAGAFSLAFAWVVFSRYDGEIGSESKSEGGQKYLPLIHGALLPAFLLALILLGLKFYGTAPTMKMALTMCFDIFLHISLYYVVLIMVLPILRKYISARACAMLWLLPNYLYITQQSYMEIPKPLFTLHVSSSLIKVLALIWLTGFIAVFGWNIIRHLAFRRRILKNAVPVTDSDVLALFQNELEETAVHKPKFQLVMSDDVSTPLTIGLYRRSTRIILPKKSYSLDELRLIFRHELIHICREDSWAKFFMMFCTAMCWFNPLMWVAMKKSAEDTELSCDETVLLGADESTRSQYANLILGAAGDDRGFSTCLSASASSMRYRLKTIVKPKKRRTGALIVGLTFFVLCMTCGYVSLAYGEDTGATTIFRDHELTEFVADDITVIGGEYTNGIDNVDAAALTEYIAGLRTQEMTGNYSYSEDDKDLSIWYNSPYGIVLVDLHTDYIQVIYLSDENDVWYTYHLPEPTDWEYVDTIVPPLPTAKVALSDGTQYGGSDLDATVIKLIRNYDGQRIVLKDKELEPSEGAGIYGSGLYLKYLDATVTFSMPVVSAVEVLVETWDHSSNYTLTLEAIDGSITFEVPDYPAHYTITASFQGNNGVYETTFTFNVGDADSI